MGRAQRRSQHQQIMEELDQMRQDLDIIKYQIGVGEKPTFVERLARVEERQGLLALISTALSGLAAYIALRSKT